MSDFKKTKKISVAKKLGKDLYLAGDIAQLILYKCDHSLFYFHTAIPAKKIPNN